MDKAALRLLVNAAFSSSGPDSLPQNDALYAGERYDDPPATEEHENLYQTCDRWAGALTEGGTAGKGGIQDAFGDPSMDLQWLNGGPTEPQPNAINMMAGSTRPVPLAAALKALAQRLPGENDPLTLDQENYGTGSHLSEASPAEGTPPRIQKALDYWGSSAVSLADTIYKWFVGTIGGRKGWKGKLANPATRAKFIATMAYIGRTYKTPVPSSAYRVCMLNNPKAAKVGYKGKLGIGPRSLLSFAQSLKASETYRDYYGKHYEHVIIKVPVTAKNYVATYQAIEAFARELADAAPQMAKFRADRYKLEGLELDIKEYKNEQEIILSFPNEAHVEVEVVGAPIKILSSVTASENGLDFEAEDPELEDDFGEEVMSGVEELQLFDPETVSQYSRESNMSNTTENRLLGRAVQDGDFDSHGYQGSDRIVTQDPDNSGYLNVHGSAIAALAAKRKSKHAKPEGKKTKHHRKTKHTYPDDIEDETWEYIARDPDDDVAGVDPNSQAEVDATQTSPLFNVAQQPMGFSG